MLINPVLVARASLSQFDFKRHVKMQLVMGNRLPVIGLCCYTSSTKMDPLEARLRRCSFLGFRS